MLRRHTRHIMLCMFMLATCACTRVEESALRLTRCANAPVQLASARAFAIGEYAYIIGGRNAQGEVSDTMYIYDAQQDSWSAVSTPLSGRVNACCVAANGKAYVGLGFHGALRDTTAYLSDWWLYDPACRQWTPLAPLPSHATVAAVGLYHDGQIYVAHGFFERYSRDVWRYDIEHDSWTLLPDSLGLSDYPDRTFGAVGATLNGHCYIGSGHFIKSRHQWSEYLPDSHQWLPLSPIPGKGRVCATAAATTEHVYVMGGRHMGGSLTTGFLFADIARYDPALDRWSRCSNMPVEAENLISFTIDNHVYFGLGENASGPLNTLYRID